MAERAQPECLFLINLVIFTGWFTSTAQTPSKASDQTNVTYTISRISLEYGPRRSAPNPELPRVDDLLNVQVELGQIGDNYEPPTPGEHSVKLTLGKIQQPSPFSAGALVAINRALVTELNRRGFYGVWAAPSSDDIEPQTGQDIRAGRKDLRIIISVAEIQRVRTIAKSPKVLPLQTTNQLSHRPISANSPLQPGGEQGRGSPFNKSLLDDYVGRLNRFPGRSVVASVAPADQSGGLALDYLISEDRPWTVFSQISNTGTGASGNWRERFGFVQQQLTRRDDILSLDYVTADFKYSEAFFGSYEAPLVYPDRLKAKVYGSYSEFTADELGLALLNVSGSQWSAGADLTFSPFSFAGPKVGGLLFQRFYLDFSLGAKWQGVQTDYQTSGTEADTDLFLPYAGVNLSSISPQTKLTAGIQFEGNLPGIAGTEQDLANLGRLDTDREWVLAKWGAGFSFFLEPLFTTYPDKLVHELAFSARGQYVLNDHRLIPQQADVIGGTYSVRGYPEAFDLGDTVFVGTAEYRFYLARALRPSLEERRLVGARVSSRGQFDTPFRFRSRDNYSRPDWDIILRAFVDGGQTFNNRRRPTETDRNLLSTGVGIDLQLRRNLNVRIDYGFALRSETENLAHPVNYGDSRVHFSATLAW